MINNNSILNEFEKEYLQMIIRKTRVNIKSLAAESKFIRQEIKKCKNESIKGCLNEHRINKLRKEARATHLVLACLKGKNYRDVELNSKSEPNWNRIKEKLRKHNMTVKMKDLFDKWIEKNKCNFNLSASK